jgi:hypothetical protein
MIPLPTSVAYDDISSHSEFMLTKCGLYSFTQLSTYHNLPLFSEPESSQDI